MFNDDEIDEVFLEFRGLTRRLGGSSTPIVRDIIMSIKRATNEIRRSHWRARVEDAPEDGMAEDANGGNLGGRQSRDDNSLLRHGAFSMEMTVSGIAPGNKSTGLDSTPNDPVHDDCHRRIGGNQAVIEAIATYTTNTEDNRAQQNQDIPSMRGQEGGSDQEPGGRVNVDYEAESVDAETLWNDDTNQFGWKGAATSTRLHCKGADTEHNRTQQNVPSSDGQDGDQAQEQAEEQKLRRSSRKRKSPVEDDGSGSGSVNDPEVRLAALRARKSFSGQSAPHTSYKRRKHTRDASKGVDDLPQLKSQLGNKATLTALRQAKNNWALIPRTFCCYSRVSQTLTAPSMPSHDSPPMSPSPCHRYSGYIISGTLLLSAFSNIFSSAISKNIGPINAMVFTHLPSAIFLRLTPAPSSLGWTVFLIAARSSIGTMDQAPCSVLLCAIFPSSERTASLGTLNAIKMLSHSGSPVITGVLMEAHRPWISFVAAGGLKALYDLGLLGFFAGTKISQLELEHADSEGRNSHHSFRSPFFSAELDRDSTITDLNLDNEPKMLHKRLSGDAVPFAEGSRSTPAN